MIGDIVAFTGRTEFMPSDLIICHGQEVLIADASDLFAAIGTKYGGNGSANFKVPAIDPIDLATQYAIVATEILHTSYSDVVVNRSTVEVRYNVNGSAYNSGTWIINPSLASVSGIARKYWKVVGDTVVKMTQPEKDAVDASLAVAPALASSSLLVWADDGNVPSSGPYYMRPGTGTSTKNEIKIRTPKAGIIRNFSVRAMTAPGTGKTDAFVFRKNGVDTAVAASLVGTAIFVKNTTNHISVTVDDDLSVKVTVASGSKSSDVVVVAEII